MGDDNEIRQIIRRESESFLTTALHAAKDVGTTYDFETEFAKTKQNRSFLVWGVIAATILALGAAAYGVTRIIGEQAAKAPVDIRVFADLNLKDLLDTAKRNENDMSQAKQELAALDYDYRTRSEAADRSYASAVESIKTRNLGASQENREIEAAAASRDEAKRRLSVDYQPAAAAKKAQIAEIQKKIDAYDQRTMAQAKQQQAVLDNERRLFDMQMKSQTAVYESQIADLKAARTRDMAAMKRQTDALAAALTARYNPVFGDARSKALLDSWKAPLDPGQPPALPPYLESRGFMDAGSSLRLDQSLADFRYLSGELGSIPYLNSVPPALSRMESEALADIATYRAALVKAAAGLEDRDAQIAELTATLEATRRALDRYARAVSEYLLANSEGGVVVDPRDPSSIVVDLNPALPAADGSTGYAVRNDRIVARLSFYLKDGRLFARVTNMKAGAGLKAFDAIVVDAAAPAAPGGGAPAAPSGSAPAAPSGSAPAVPSGGTQAVPAQAVPAQAAPGGSAPAPAQAAPNVSAPSPAQ